jgi:hypothetical protein
MVSSCNQRGEAVTRLHRQPGRQPGRRGWRTWPSVITDTAYGFAVVVASRNRKTFVLPSDSDFVKLLNDPSAFGIKYLPAVPNTGRGVSDALNLRYPTLYETGAEVATLELEIPNDGDNQPDWRLYRVNEPTAVA